MKRETKEQLAARIAEDNRLAALIPVGTKTVDIAHGEVVLGAKVGVLDGWDLYEIKHSGFTHKSSSAVIRRAFSGK